MINNITYPLGKPDEVEDVVWRCDARRYAYCSDPDADTWSLTHPRLEMWWYSVRKRTAKGVYIYGRDTITYPLAKRSQYRNTPAEALTSFIERRKRQIGILKAALNRAEYELQLATDVSPDQI